MMPNTLLHLTVPYLRTLLPVNQTANLAEYTTWTIPIG